MYQTERIAVDWFHNPAKTLYRTTNRAIKGVVPGDRHLQFALLKPPNPLSFNQIRFLEYCNPIFIYLTK